MFSFLLQIKLCLKITISQYHISKTCLGPEFCVWLQQLDGDANCRVAKNKLHFTKELPSPLSNGATSIYSHYILLLQICKCWKLFDSNKSFGSVTTTCPCLLILVSSCNCTLLIAQQVDSVQLRFGFGTVLISLWTPITGGD